jgi:hypothetical protein
MVNILHSPYSHCYSMKFFLIPCVRITEKIVAFPLEEHKHLAYTVTKTSITKTNKSILLLSLSNGKYEPNSMPIKFMGNVL